MKIPKAVFESAMGHQRELQVSVDDLIAAGDMDNFWLMFGAVLVFLMQAGFAMLEVRAARARPASTSRGPAQRRTHETHRGSCEL
eukprot:scaffold1534_cov267-Pinguiococcus_pyrenoidosus.AAC.12